MAAGRAAAVWGGESLVKWVLRGVCSCMGTSRYNEMIPQRKTGEG